MHIDNGLLQQARQVSSPNYDHRPENTLIDLLVIHAISLPANEYGGPWIDQLFCNTLNSRDHADFSDISKLKVSSHVLIRRDGEIVQYVPFQYRAWHAGQSRYQQRENCNDFSIGIELEGCDQHPFENIQYQQLGHLILTLFQQYPQLNQKRITGHSDIAPGRKTDPGPHFDWPYLQTLINPPTNPV